MAAETSRPWRSGWCGRGTPASSHARCSGYSTPHGYPCVCSCHDEEVIDVEIVDGPEAVDVEVGSEAWLAERRKGVAASEIAGLLGIAPDNWTSPFNLYWLKKAGIGDDRDNKEMAWGRRLEALVLERFAELHPELHVEPGVLFRSGFQYATPDGLAYERRAGDTTECPTHDFAGGYCVGFCPDRELAHRDPVAVVQVKTAGRRDHWGEEGTDEIPPYYVAQVRWEMDVFGVSTAYVPVLFAGSDYREYIVEQNTQDVELMRKEAAAFLDRLARDDPPDVDYRAATIRTLKVLHPDVDDAEVELEPRWVEQYRAARDTAKEAEKAKAEAEAHIRDQLGRAARGVVDGVKVCSRSVYDVRERTLSATTVNRLTVTRERTTE